MEALRDKIIQYVSVYVKKQGKLSFWISLVIGCLVFMEVAAWIKGDRRDILEPRVLVATRDLSADIPLSLIDFTFRYENGKKTEGALTDQDLHLLSGAKLQRPLGHGEILVLDNLILQKKLTGLSMKIPKGMRAYTIQPNNTVPLRPGDKVDVLWSKGGEKDMPMPLISGISVLNYSTLAEKVSLVVAVSENDLPVLEKAREYGKLTVALRNPDEVSASEASNEARRHPLLNRQNSGKQIEIISEGGK